MPTQESSRIERTGRSWACWSAGGWAFGLFIAVVATWAVTGWISGWTSAFWLFPAWALYVVLLAPAILLLIVRWWATRILFPPGPVAAAESTAETAEPLVAEPLIAEPDGVVICCSGGGVKSAAFCLGALQALQKQGTYGNAKAIVGVSGGGYMAAAFAARAKSDDNADILAPGSPDVDQIRRRSNYLASSPAIRFDLVASVLWGFVVNTFIIGAGVFLLTWLVVRQARLVGLVDTPPDSDWTLTSEAWKTLALPAIPMLVALIFFLGRRYSHRPGAPKPHRNASDADETRSGGDESGPATVRSLVLTNIPNRLFSIGVLVLLLYPGAPYLSVQLHNWLRSFPGWGAVIAGLAAFLTFLLTVLSSLKGIRQPARTGQDQNVVGFYRQKIAPRIGIALAVLAFYFGAVMLTQYYLVHEVSLAVPATLGVLALIFGSANKTSLFPFYRDQLDYAYLSSNNDSGSKLLSDLPNANPELVLCGTANVKDSDLLPSGRNGTTFIFSRSAVGFTDDHLPDRPQPKPLSKYSIGRGGSALDLATAMAISGAAVAPLAGRQDKVSGANRILLTLANVRLGVWVRNPYWTARREWLALHMPSTLRADAAPIHMAKASDQPDNEEGGSTDAPTAASAAGAGQTAPLEPASSIRSRLQRMRTRISGAVLWCDDLLHRISAVEIIKEAMVSPRIHGCYVYVTDGGHYDNLGLVEGLRRRPKRLIMIDGSGDPEDQFPAMGDAIASARIDLGIEISFDPTPLQRNVRPHPESAWTTAKATYRGQDGTCDINYLKCLLPAGLTWDVQSYGLRNPSFPATSQKYEMYDEFDFEAFRQLGWVLAHRAEKHSWVALTLSRGE